MRHIRLGIRLESLGVPLRQALEWAARQGVTGVQFDALGDLAPRQLSETGRRQIRHLLRTHNLELTALGCPLRHDLDHAEGLDARLQWVREVMDLSFDLGARLVVICPGRTPANADDPRAPLLREALVALGQHGDRAGTLLAWETGLEDGPALAAYLDSFDCGSLRANLDPANLMLHGHDPYAAVRALSRRIVYAHARDIRRTGANRLAQEVPLGHGDIDWMEFLAALEEVEYRGWLVIERETGDQRSADMAAGVAFLRRFVPAAGN